MNPRPSPSRPRGDPRLRRVLEWVFQGGTGLLALLSAVVFVSIAAVLAHNSYPTILHYGPGFITVPSGTR